MMMEINRLISLTALCRTTILSVPSCYVMILYIYAPMFRCKEGSLHCNCKIYIENSLSIGRTDKHQWYIFYAYESTYRGSLSWSLDCPSLHNSCRPSSAIGDVEDVVTLLVTDAVERDRKKEKCCRFG